MRSLLFVPATAPHFLEKAAQRGADAIILDLEDSVVPQRKQEARERAPDAALRLSGEGATVGLRVNAAEELWRLDLAHAALAPAGTISLVMLPKVHGPEQVLVFVQELERLFSRGGDRAVPAIAAVLESPRAILNAAAIARSSDRLQALGFGAEDYCTALGIEPDPEVLAWSAQHVITAAHAHGLECWGLAAGVAEIADLQRYEHEVLRARALGFTGSVAVHPAQIPVLNRCFSPSPTEVAWARRVVRAYQQSSAAGAGAAMLDGRMIDQPIVERAQRYLEWGEPAGPRA
ncbi:CoA ester lyase [Candidimonas humi]|uniref:HpcH/HpaI aldolase/citrate lyase family protein n=1 Tax=Candidimonas humi TaxID=683355 RepID=A0ABV8NXG1_9BURK|nr:CoA ester lyase [Candidimonas humi]MBV6304983.1 CoA ester lyase [Candidimonas humi]